jgi:hypothetical protein
LEFVNTTAATNGVGGAIREIRALTWQNAPVPVGAECGERLQLEYLGLSDLPEQADNEQKD